MTRFSKILAVFVTIASLGFFGAVMISSFFAPPNWLKYSQADYFDGYAIAKTVSADAAWEATRASDGGKVATSKSLPSVLAKVMDDHAQQQQQELSELSERQPQIQEKIDKLQKLNKIDEAAMQAYIQALRARLSEITQQYNTLSEKVAGMSAEASDVENQVKARRDDVTRLGQEVQEVEADLFRVKQAYEQLTDVKYQLQELIDRAEERYRLLNYSPQ